MTSVALVGTLTPLMSTTQPILQLWWNSGLDNNNREKVAMQKNAPGHHVTED